jgi:hypothetical protein
MTDVTCVLGIARRVESGDCGVETVECGAVRVQAAAISNQQDAVAVPRTPVTAHSESECVSFNVVTVYTPKYRQLCTSFLAATANPNAQ